MAYCFIQWKGTDVDMDLKCNCGVTSRVTGYLAYNIKCCVCGTIYKSSHKIELTELADTPDGSIIKTINPNIKNKIK